MVGDAAEAVVDETSEEEGEAGEEGADDQVFHDSWGLGGVEGASGGKTGNAELQLGMAVGTGRLNDHFAQGFVGNAVGGNGIMGGG